VGRHEGAMEAPSSCWVLEDILTRMVQADGKAGYVVRLPLPRSGVVAQRIEFGVGL
jgi:hypothetical protein